MRPSRILCFALLCGSLSSCIVGGSCSLIGCINGVRITWSGRTGDERVVLIADGARHEITCPTNTPTLSCDLDGVRFEGQPQTLQVEVTTPAGVRTGTFSPTYQTSTPNGPDCGPVCYQATVTVM